MNHPIDLPIHALSDIRVLFYGTADFAVASLQALYDAGCHIVGVVTAPDRPAGRGHKLQASDVKTAALRLGLPIFQPEKLSEDSFVQIVKELNPTIGVIVAFRMLPEKLWSLPPWGTINIHGSLLPDYRGAAPINWAIIDGNRRTGNTLFSLSHDIDTGDIWDRVETEILPEDHFESLYNRMKGLGATMLIQNLQKIVDHGQLPKATPQNKLEGESPCRPAPKLNKENTRIDWNKSPQEIHNLVRGLYPIPSAWSWMHLEKEPEPLLVKVYGTQLYEEEPHTASFEVGKAVLISKNRWGIVCKNGIIEITSIKPQGKKALNSSEFINGYLRGENPSVRFS